MLTASALLAQNSKRGVEIAGPDTPPERAGRRYALLIGVNAYAGLPPLKTALADAQAVASTLRSFYGFETEVLPNAKRDDILSALNRYRRRLAPEDSMLIYYAGHGHFDRTLGKAYWLPADAAPDDTTHWIISDDITSSVKALPARHVLIVSDSCYSGTLSRAGPDSLQAGSEGDRPRYLARMSRSTSRMLLASGGNEPVSDGDGDGKHSIFASVLLQGLEQRPPGKFTVEELFHQNVRERVAGRSGQAPECTPLLASGHDGGSFIFERSSVRAADAMPRALEMFDSMDEDAIVEFEKVLRAQPGTLDAMAFHALAICEDTGRRVFFSDAVKEAQAVLAQQPGNIMALVTLGNCSFAMPNRSVGHAAVEGVIKILPSDARGFFLRGLAFRGLSDWPHAVEDFTTALRLKPDFVRAFFLRGLTYYNQKQYQTAISDFTQVLRLRPVFRAFELRGLTYRNLRQLDQALADYSEALRIRPDSANTLVSRGGTYYDLRKYEQAISDYTEAIRLDPGYYSYNLRGFAYSLIRQYDKAIADYSESIRLSPSYVRALINRANAYRLTREFDKAIADYTAAIQLDAKDTEARDNRGLVYSLQGNSDAAFADWTESLRLNPKNVRAMNFRAAAYIQAKQYDRAIAACTEFLSHNPNHAQALAQRARAKEAAGDAAGAKADRDAAKVPANK